MFTGYSALAMAEALPDDGVVVACEVDAGVAAFARKCFDDSPAGHKITSGRRRRWTTLERSLPTASRSTSSSSTPTRRATWTTWISCSTARCCAREVIAWTTR